MCAQDSVMISRGEADSSVKFFFQFQELDEWLQENKVHNEANWADEMT